MIDSLAQLKYDDKRKLILAICDGNIVGSGNDRPTPRIVLEILGADPNLEPEALGFVSLDEGARQHNTGNVYSGLYECAGHVVQQGTSCLRKESEMFHQIKNVIGINPTFFEYLFTVDADTTVEPYSVNRLISACIHDKKCSAWASLIYEFAGLRVLPLASHGRGFREFVRICYLFTEPFYPLSTANARYPFVSVDIQPDGPELLAKLCRYPAHEDFSTPRRRSIPHHASPADFPAHKTQFVRDAHAYIIAPDDWKILLLQRRHWINSTVHSLGELTLLEHLCGFYCFSMRLVVMIDLVSAMVQPITAGYMRLVLSYLIFPRS
ncbi:hypothetical protein AZE42_01575 [Rhizopogon vesiculosus]|uniref:chitin synthase n=1 Tax=Rhizopogon vesiculosus TaxID=180088 RepID=A0A1J8PZQ1_9AGAM|nr:hypothetical protein AZE42_01575 [Rhizopogon vesiculosus]